MTPFGRLQFSTTAQNAFTESGANSLNLNVAEQTTNSLRTVFGAVTAAFSGAPGASFTVYGAAPARDATFVGFSAGTTIAEATQLYLRYDGTLGSGTDNHALTAGLRLSW